MGAVQLYPKGHCEWIRQQAKQRFDKVRPWWIECGEWAAPHKMTHLYGGSGPRGERRNRHIVDNTHTLALRSYVAGFLEGNTSASRPWYRIGHPDPDVNLNPDNRLWLDGFTRRTLAVLGTSNFYTAAGEFYYDHGTFNTGAYYIEELPNRTLHFHNLEAGSYYCLNNGIGVADILIREFTLTVKALVDTYGKKKNGRHDWSNFSDRVKKMYEDGNYAQEIDIVHIVKPNDDFDNSLPHALLNRPWLSMTYELGGTTGQYYQDGMEFGFGVGDDSKHQTYLNYTASKRKPFIVGRSASSGNYEYGLKGPTLDALGTIRSLNKKAIGKDVALDKMLNPALQGPASLRKSYISGAPGAYVPLDAQSAVAGGLKPINQINPAVATLIQDVSDLRDQVDKIYFADYLLYLTRNPKTRTATETNAVIQEQQLIIGPNLQSLDWTHNNPVVDFVMNYVIDEDPFLDAPPEGLEGEWLQTNFISVFAQSQKSADLPSIDRYRQMIMEVAQIDASILDKFDADKYADIYEDRLYLPAGLNRAQTKVDALREKQAMQAQREKALHETLPAVAGAAKDLGVQPKQQ